MIRRFQAHDLSAVLQIWLDANRDAHRFVPADHWTDHFEAVAAALPLAEVFVHVDEDTDRIDGFIGLDEDHIEGLFVEKGRRSRGIGRQLLDHAKGRSTQLSLCVYRKNDKALSLYRRERFVVQSEGVDPDTGEAELRMLWRR